MFWMSCLLVLRYTAVQACVLLTHTAAVVVLLCAFACGGRSAINSDTPARLQDVLY